jgi:hypothetical protein
MNFPMLFNNFVLYRLKRRFNKKAILICTNVDRKYLVFKRIPLLLNRRALFMLLRNIHHIYASMNVNIKYSLPVVAIRLSNVPYNACVSYVHHKQ